MTPAVASPHDRRPDRPLPLVLVHGFTGDTSTWEPLAAHLAHDRPVWAVDLVGHGESDVPDDAAAYTMPGTVVSLEAHLDERGIQRAHVIGYSMGGRVALSFGAAHGSRVASLVLIGASPGYASDAERQARRRADEALAERIATGGLESFVRGWMADPLFATQARLGPDHLAAATAQRLRCQPRALAATLRGMGTGAMPALHHALPGIECPVLFVAGGLDAKFTALAYEMAGQMPQANVAIVPDAGHAVHVEAAPALAALIAQHLDGLP